MIFLLRKNRKIIILAIMFILLLLFPILFYNRNKDSIAQEVELVCEGEEIPLGEALDETLALVKEVETNIEAIFSSASDQVKVAKTLFDFPKQCTASNCQTGCKTEQKIVCVGVCQDVCKTVDVCGACGDPCPAGKICTEKDCDKQIIVDGDVFLIPDKKYCWEEQKCEDLCQCDTTCPGGKTCYQVGSLQCWGDPECKNACQAICDIFFECKIKPCSGNPCPSGAEDLLFQIQKDYGQIKSSKEAIYNEIGKRGDILKKLEKVREELAKCVTPAHELTEAEAKEVEALLTCLEAKYQKALPSGKEDCDNPNNFVCCHFK